MGGERCMWHCFSGAYGIVSAGAKETSERRDGQSVLIRGARPGGRGSGARPSHMERWSPASPGTGDRDRGLGTEGRSGGDGKEGEMAGLAEGTWDGKGDGKEGRGSLLRR
jgi:hypothetical protein